MAWDSPPLGSSAGRGRLPYGAAARGLFAWLRNGRGVAGLAGSGLVWVLSAAALAMAMRANLQAHVLGLQQQIVLHLRGIAVIWAGWFVLLQLASFLAFAFTIRAAYRVRAAICFTAGAGFVMFGDLLGLFALMVWVGIRMSAQ